MLYRPFEPSVESKPTIDTKSGGLGNSTKKTADKPEPTWLDKAGSAFEKAQARFARTAPTPDPIKLYNKPEFTLGPEYEGGARGFTDPDNPYGTTFPSQLGSFHDDDEPKSTTGIMGIGPDGEIVEYGLPEMTISDATAPYRAIPTRPAIQTGELAPAIQDTSDEEKQALIDMEEDAIKKMEQKEKGLMSKLGVQEKQLEPKVIPAVSKTDIEGIQQVLTDLNFDPNGVDGKVGGGTKRALRKFQKAHGLKVDGKITQEVVDVLNSGMVKEGPDVRKIDADISTFTDQAFHVFKEEVAKLESKGSGGYSAIGGDEDMYDGKYQMGEDAKLDAARALGITLNHDAAGRKAFRDDPELQERAFRAYTLSNHKELSQMSEIYRNLSPEKKLGVLGYAHNQGATAAAEWLYTGVSGKDAFGTKGSKYTKKIGEAFNKRDFLINRE